jgi:hypothetical protein
MITKYLILANKEMCAAGGGRLLLPHALPIGDAAKLGIEELELQIPMPYSI